MQEDTSDELEALKAIYENSLEIIKLDDSGIELIYGNTNGLQLNIKLDETYPKKLKSICLNVNGVLNEIASADLKSFSSENIGTPMLYTLISKAEEMFNSKQSVDPTQKLATAPEEIYVAETNVTVKDEPNVRKIKKIEEVVRQSGIETSAKKMNYCQFFKKGKCKFKDKCHNIHSKGEQIERKSNENHQKKQNKYNEESTVSSTKTQSKKKGDSSEVSSSKKASMKTATDVIHRILWDDALPTEQFTVGYLDRFIGVIEKPFSAFSWEDLASVDYNVLAVPKHRIQYFKYVDVIIWDKNERLDKVFGSTGDKETILDIISKIDLEEYNKNTTTQRMETKQVIYDARNKPNYFLCLPISDKEIKEKVKQAQNHIISIDDRLSEISHDTDRLHVTLCMMRMTSDEEKKKATSVLQSLENLLPCVVPTNAFQLDINFIEHFGKRVVYATVQETVEFSKLVGIIKTKFEQAGIHLCGNYDVFTPHLTMLKISRPFTEETGISEINPYMFKDIQNMNFGRQAVDSLRICEVGKERGDDNFYVTLASIKNSILSISDYLPALIAGNLKEQMANGIIDEIEGDCLFADILSDDCSKFEKTLGILENSYSKTKWKSTKMMIIMRGLPGSGKSYISRNLTCDGKTKVVCSADDYFEELEISYNFDGTDIDKAHQQCRDRVLECIDRDVDVIIIDNTHSQRWEYRIYELIAILCGYKHYVLEIPCDGESARQSYQQRSVHNVKDHIHKEMFKRWQQDPQAITCMPRNTKIHLDWIIQERYQPILYSGLFLDDRSREQLLSIHPARLKNVHADHMTIMYEPTFEHLKNLPVGTSFRIQIESYIGNSEAQAVSLSELNSSLCSQPNPHITIATNQTFRASDVSKMLKSSFNSHPTNRAVLTGVVGVKIAISEKESVRCIDGHYFKKFLDEYYHLDNKEIDDQIVEKEEEDEEKSFGIYSGPCDVITCLNVFDFDATLFFTPDPVEGRNKYQKLTGHPWPRKGWLSCDESLASPLHVYPGPSLPDYRSHVSRASSYNIMCTGRLERVREGVEGVLAIHGLKFDRLILKPDDGQHYSRTNVKNYKRGIIADLLKEFPKVNVLNFWDDRIDNIESIKSLKKYNKNIQFNLYHIQERFTVNNINSTSTFNVFKKLGCTQDDDYKIAVNEVTSVLLKAWHDVLGVEQTSQQLMYFFGSHLLNRRSDVDVCLIGPTSLSTDECILKLADVLEKYGFQYLHTATGIRCPRLKLKAMFCGHTSVTFDIVVACVLKDLGNDGIDFVEVRKRCEDKKRLIALDGIIFARNVVDPILDRISETDFGMLIDSLIILLRRNHLKGNAFHCIRTFHLVNCIAEFIGGSPSNALPQQGLENIKDFEKLLKSALQHLSLIGFESYRKKFKGFVPDSYIQPLIDCFEKATRLSIEDILFQGPQLIKLKENERVVQFTLEARNDIQLWKFSTILEARTGSFVRQLIDRGFKISPKVCEENILSFTLSTNGNQFKEIQNLVKYFVKDFEEECKGSSLNVTFISS